MLMRINGFPAGSRMTSPQRRLLIFSSQKPTHQLAYTARNAYNALASAEITNGKSVDSRRNRVYSTRASTHAQAQEANDIAILGGGITGLATAHYLTEQIPEAKITIYESSERFGGWVHSEVVETDSGPVTFEAGPRSLRPEPPNGFLALSLVSSEPDEGPCLSQIQAGRCP